MDEYYANNGGKVDETYETLDGGNQQNASEEKHNEQEPGSGAYVHSKDDLGQLEVMLKCHEKILRKNRIIKKKHIVIS